MLGFAALGEDLDDDHAATAARARLRQRARLMRFIWFRGSVDLGLGGARRHGEQLARARNVGERLPLANSP